MGSRSPGLLETAAACAEQQLEAFTAPQLAKVAWSFAKLGWPVPRVLRHAGAQLAADTAAFGDKEASNVLWALAVEVRCVHVLLTEALALGGCAEAVCGSASDQHLPSSLLGGALYWTPACSVPGLAVSSTATAAHPLLVLCRGRPFQQRHWTTLQPTCSRASGSLGHRRGS